MTAGHFTQVAANTKQKKSNIQEMIYQKQPKVFGQENGTEQNRTARKGKTNINSVSTENDVCKTATKCDNKDSYVCPKKKVRGGVLIKINTYNAK